MDANGNRRAGRDERDADIDDVFEELEELERLVDTPAEREQVQETMRTLRRAGGLGLFTGFRSAFGSRDAGEAMVGSFLIGMPMVVEGGTLEIGAFIAANPAYFWLTLLFGVVPTLGILHAAGFDEIAADRLFGVVPVRLVSVLAIAGLMAVGLMTVWGRVDWATPGVALAQSTVVATVMAVGASIGDVLPE